MILDTLSNAARYENLHPLFPPALRHLRELAKCADLSDGRIDIDGDALYAIVARGKGKPRAAARNESHRRYIDIQYTMEGSDIIGWMPTSECHESLGYDKNKDVEFYADVPASWIEVKEDYLAIFFPHDAHAPMANTDQPMVKIVIKVAV